MKHTYILPVLCLFVFSSRSVAQVVPDTGKVQQLGEIEINGHKPIGGTERQPDVKDHVIYAGKKTEVVVLANSHADLSSGNMRQVLAKVPGVSVWENDGSGIQVNIAARGLSPNRSWEFNMRQNGYDISSDPFGYPEAYYNPPMEALERIEVVRGAASLQYGPQFGGVVNYQFKKANPDKAAAAEVQQTFGSYGLVNTYTALGGTIKKFSYYGFMHHRTAEGWRANSRYNTFTGYVSAGYQFTPKIKLELEYTGMNYVSQQPGGLTDTQFETDHRQSLRERNWFSTPWNVGAMTFKYAINPKLNLQVKAFTTIAQRNSVGFTKAINIADTINAATSEYAARQVDRDNYANYGAETRLTWNYNLFGKAHTLAGGVRGYTGSTERKQLGVGTTGTSFDLTLTNPQYGRALEFTTTNAAVFAENIFYIGERLKVIPGARFEYLANSISGYINTTAAGTVTPETRTRQVLLLGLGTELRATSSTTVYANFAQAYRPVTFSELTPSATTDVIDPNLQDASGFNADLGYRGTWKNILNFDISLYYLHYDNRIGTITQDGLPFRTNIGTSVSKGVESFIEFDPVRIFVENPKAGSVRLFASNAFVDATYVKWNNPAIANDPTKSIENKKVENAPATIHRMGATYSVKTFSATCQLSDVGDVFTDAANTELPNAAGTIGKLEGYRVMDVSLACAFMKHYNIKAGVNNLTDEKYATRRSGGYPGPGILPGNGRTVYVSFGASF
jgi:Fe(3+) dicitrate transport protein